MEKLFCFALVFLANWIGFAESGRRGLLVPHKPDHEDAVATARWLISQNNWGVLSTISIELGGAPFGLDPTPRNAMKDARSSFTVSQFPIGTCGKKDPENPSCAKLTLTGKLKLVDINSKEVSVAKEVLFAKHPEMKYWPKDHNFQIFKLEIEDIFLVNWFGGAKPITVAQYLRPRINQLASVM
ncbi:hypothetical protein MKW98_022785 [Papaver atlanticum]|uniref:CREG-like beta-barrel domain-containing protein n=1 Tax=Papaver atlanticum TaxID=357466 RepID=A0AAD4TID6_9MAGN|nr:hypothetical protein MKW98_022785 [Papaver atlanticum]